MRRRVSHRALVPTRASHFWSDRSLTQFCAFMKHSTHSSHYSIQETQLEHQHRESKLPVESVKWCRLRRLISCYRWLSYFNSISYGAALPAHCSAKLFDSSCFVIKIWHCIPDSNRPARVNGETQQLFGHLEPSSSSLCLAYSGIGAAFWASSSVVLLVPEQLVNPISWSHRFVMEVMPGDTLVFGSRQFS